MLSSSVQKITDLDEFRNAVGLIYTPTQLYKPYMYGTSKSCVQISRMRMGLSGLNAHRKSYHFIEYSTCDKCNARQEDSKHFLLECPAYAAHRMEMIGLLTDLVPDKTLSLRSVSTRKKLCKTLLFGTNVPEKDYKIFDVVADFINKTQRFIYVLP